MDESYRQQVEDQLRTRCIHLRTKEAFVGLPSEHEEAFPADAAIWWCDETGEPLGPDGHAADEGCHGPCDRPCFQAPIRPSLQ
ncbi:MAG: hypothetical protein QNJ98_03560 [Planctomycetota bacterium]|nr:hypothetical protein [Planctomycetota bacterium]